MKIIIYGINFSPELTGVGKYTGEMAEWLADQGEEVLVITAPPYYPEWKIGAGYSASKYRFEENSGMKIWRCPIWLPKHKTGLKRILHLLTFAVSSLPVLFKQIFWKPDIIIVIEPTFFCAPLALIAAKICASKSWLHIQDFEMDAAFSLGLLKTSFLQKIIFFFEATILHRFDMVSTISNRMLDKLRGKGVEKSRGLLFPNWVDTELIRPLSGPSPMRKELGISEDKVVALYAGNMGQKHGLETLIHVAKNLRTNPEIEFVLCGQGVARPLVQSLTSDLSNVHCLPLQPTERLNDLLNLADIHLLPQRADAADLVMPSRLTGMLASGRPVIATAHSGTEIAQVLKPRGLVVEPEDSHVFEEALLWLAEHPEERDRMGKSGREFAVENLNKEKILRNFEKKLTLLANL